jgi:hypothetical protein
MRRRRRKHYTRRMPDPTEKTRLWTQRQGQSVEPCGDLLSPDESPKNDFDKVMSRLQHVRSSGPYTREEMNER